ncbi:general substrate transporter [Coprinopsis sp. MPI-PUGE-AT-0042]|nr:general substrate transporter [Coprinopsis sp. MPI-PUGE-AT-0042]
MFKRGNTGVSPYLQGTFPPPSSSAPSSLTPRLPPSSSRTDNPPTAIVGSSLNIAAIAASLISAHLCDTLGRRLTIRLGALLYTLASLIQIFVPSLSSFLVGRVIQGLAAGTLLTAIPVFQCEIAPAGKRGMFVGIEYMFMTIGYALASWIGFGLLSSAATAPRESEMAWRGLFIIQIVLGLMLGVSTFYIPESPRWLIQHGHPTQAIQVLADLHGTGNFDDAIILQSFTEIETAIQLETKGGQALHAGWRDLFGAYKKRGLVANASQQFTQSNGINAVLFFLVDNLLRAGFKLDKAALYAAGCAMVLCAGTVVNVVCVDRVGRRPLLITGGIGLSIAVAVIGAMQLIVDAEKVSSGVLRLPGARGILGFMCVYLFVFGAT